MLAVVFVLIALNAWAEMGVEPLDVSDDPVALRALQALSGLAAAAAAWGAWTGTRWAPAAAVGYGLVTAGMIVALDPLLDLGPDARGGLWIGAAVVLAFALWAAWYVRRVLRRDGAVRDGAVSTRAG